MIDAKVREHVIKHLIANGYKTTDEDIIETIRYATRVYKGEGDSRRWWEEFVYVVEIDGMFIEYIDAETTGDDSAEDKGYEFDPSSIREVFKKERIVTEIYYE